MGEWGSGYVINQLKCQASAEAGYDFFLFSVVLFSYLTHLPVSADLNSQMGGFLSGPGSCRHTISSLHYSAGWPASWFWFCCCFGLGVHAASIETTRRAKK